MIISTKSAKEEKYHHFKNLNKVPGEMRILSEDSISMSFSKRQAETETEARTYAKSLKLVLEQANGLYLKDVNNDLYIDCLCGAGALTLGHNHPVVKQALMEALKSDLPLLTLDMTTSVKDAFVQELFKTLPGSFANNAKILFCGPTGSDAVEAALKLAKTVTGRTGIFAFHGAYHGQTHGALSLMGNIETKKPINGLIPDVHFMPFPFKYRNPMGMSNDTNCDVDCINYIENLLNDPKSGIVKPAAVIIEVTQGEAGTIHASDFFVKEIRRITKEHDILLIVDEVQSGFGRTGKMFAFEHSGIIPDIVVMSKALGGSLPLAAIMFNKHLDVWKIGAHTGTFRGNQLAMAAGTASMKFTKENNLPEHAKEMGKIFKSRLVKIQEQTNFIGDVRVQGLMIGIELINSEIQPNRLGHPAFNTTLAQFVRKKCLENGLIVELGGRNSSVVRLLPPLIITKEQVDDVCDILERVLLSPQISES